MFALYKKEVQSYFYSPLAYVISALFMLIFSLSFISGISDLSSNTFKFSFPNIFYNNFFFFILLIPFLTMRSFAEERKGGTEVLLMSAPISIIKIVLAKFLAITTVFLLMMLLTLFFPLVTMMTGEVIWSSLFSAYVGFFLWGLSCIALGMLISAFTENPIIAAIVGAGAMIVLIFIDNLATTALFSSLPIVSDVLLWFSTEKRFLGFSQGLFRFGDLVFYLTLVFLFLSWTVITIQKRRWSRG